ncbi:hypothetical protein ACLOJK_023521 [Asimina triloba]
MGIWVPTRQSSELNRHLDHLYGAPLDLKIIGLNGKPSDARVLHPCCYGTRIKGRIHRILFPMPLARDLCRRSSMGLAARNEEDEGQCWVFLGKESCSALPCQSLQWRPCVCLQVNGDGLEWRGPPRDADSGGPLLSIAGLRSTVGSATAL